MRAAWAKSDFLFESVVCDLHLMALAIAGFAMLVSARAVSDGGWSIRGWDGVLVDDSQPMRLTLRFHKDLGLSAATAARIASFYAKVADAKADGAELAQQANADRRELSHLAERWRRLCQDGVVALEGVAADTRQRLPASYADDARTLIGFLREAAKGDIGRVDKFGGLAMPMLRQRREAPRVALRQGCYVILASGRMAAEIEDVSRNGLGLICKGPLREGQEIVVEVAGGRRLKGVVARRNGDSAGLRLAAPLEPTDPLFGSLAR